MAAEPASSAGPSTPSSRWSSTSLRRRAVNIAVARGTSARGALDSAESTEEASDGAEKLEQSTCFVRAGALGGKESGIGSLEPEALATAVALAI